MIDNISASEFPNHFFMFMSNNLIAFKIPHPACQPRIQRHVLTGFTMWDGMSQESDKRLVGMMESHVILTASSSSQVGHHHFNLEFPRVGRCRPTYMQQYNFIPPLKVCKYQFPDLEKEKVKNRYSLALLPEQNPDSYKACLWSQGASLGCQATITAVDKSRDWFYTSCNECAGLEDVGDVDDAYFHLAH
ncbi:hypothetical protein Tco_0222627 [Tanacetum coccineum]